MAVECFPSYLPPFLSRPPCNAVPSRRSHNVWRSSLSTILAIVFKMLKMQGSIMQRKCRLPFPPQFASPFIIDSTQSWALLPTTTKTLHTVQQKHEFFSSPPKLWNLKLGMAFCLFLAINALKEATKTKHN